MSVAIGYGGGSISVDGDWVDWKPSGLGVASQRLLVRSIVSVEAKTASMLTNGSVIVTFAVEGGRQAAAGRVLFKRSQAQHFGPMVDWLQSIADYNRANGTTPSPVEAPSPASTPDPEHGRNLARKAPTTGGVTRTSPYGQRPKWMQDGMSGTLITGPEPLEVVGESFHQGELAAIAKARRGESEVIAILVAEEGNPYDPNAIGVWIDGMQVGHIGRGDAAELRPGLIRLYEQHGAVALEGYLVGGTLGSAPVSVDAPSFGVWLRYDPVDFGVEKANPPLTMQSGLSHSLATDLRDDSYDLSWLDSLSESPSKRLTQLRGLLDTEADPISRHYVFLMLESDLYAWRDAIPTALEEFDEVTRRHDSEMDAIRPALIGKFDGQLPNLETYKQACIRHTKAKNLPEALWWAHRGVEVYGDAAHKEEWLLDLRGRATKLQARLDRENATPARHEETLVCQTCGAEFTRAVTTGRKPLNCPACR